MRGPTLDRLLFLALAACLPACGGGSNPVAFTPPCTDAAFAGQPLGVRCGQLVDTEGRIVLLRGVNARVAGVFDVVWDRNQPPLMDLASFSADDATRMRGFGFDALRLPLQWSGLEPTADGGFDEAYLDRVADVVGFCRGAGIRVLLDMHQDDYSKYMGGDGAPLWAIEPAPVKIGPTPPGVTAQIEGQVIQAYDTFFGGSADGAALQARFIAAATHVAARFASDPAVIGLEIYNEPPPDITALVPFYQAALPAVRAVMPDKIFAFEPSALRNIIDTAPLGSGSLGAGTAYAPHIYTYVFNSGSSSDQMTMTKDDLATSNQSAAAEAASWEAPPLVTEWGYDPAGINAEQFFTWQAELQEQYQLSSFMWVWKELPPSEWGCFDYDSATGAFTERALMKKVLARVRPAAVAGWPSAISFDRASGVFSLTFAADPTIKGPHLVAVAPALGAPLGVTCDGAAVTPLGTDAYGTLSVMCGQGDGAKHTLQVNVAPLP